MSEAVHSLLPQERDALSVKFQILSGNIGAKYQSHEVVQIQQETNSTLVKVRRTYFHLGKEWELSGEFERPASKIPASIPKKFSLTECKSSDELSWPAFEVEALCIQALHMGTSF